MSAVNSPGSSRLHLLLHQQVSSSRSGSRRGATAHLQPISYHSEPMQPFVPGNYFVWASISPECPTASGPISCSTSQPAALAMMTHNPQHRMNKNLKVRGTILWWSNYTLTNSLYFAEERYNPKRKSMKLGRQCSPYFGKTNMDSGLEINFAEHWARLYVLMVAMWSPPICRTDTHTHTPQRFYHIAKFSPVNLTSSHSLQWVKTTLWQGPLSSAPCPRPHIRV